MKKVIVAVVAGAFVCSASMVFASGYKPPGNKAVALSGSVSGAAASADVDNVFDPYNKNFNTNINAPETNSAATAISDVNIGIKDQQKQDQDQSQAQQAVAFGGAGGSGGSSSANNQNTVIVDLSSKNNTYHNRQHIGSYGVSPGPTAQMFDEWEKGAWNVNNIRPRTYKAGLKETKIDWAKEPQCEFYVDKEPVDEVELVGYLYHPEESVVENRIKWHKPNGDEIGFCDLVATDETSSKKLELYVAWLAMQNGADQVEILQWDGRKKPTVDGWSIGFGGNGGVLAGPEEQLAGNIGGGTHKGKSSVVKETEPFLSVLFWRNGDKKTAIIETAPKDKVVATGTPSAKPLKRLPVLISDQALN